MNNFTLFHKGKTYNFSTADELYIFALGIENGVEQKLHTDIETFAAFVYLCHSEDCHNAPLKPFALFITDWWNELYGRDKQYVVNKYYEIFN